MEPDEGEIQSVLMVTGLDPVFDRALVIAALKAKNNSSAVINEFFDDPDKFRSTYRWDESAFSADRDGLGGSSTIPSFTIHSQDEGVIQGVSPKNWYDETPGAPSRPPSRANNRSPLSRLVDLTLSHADVPSTQEQEDEHLQRALAESVAVSGRQTPLHEPQDSGVMQGPTTKGQQQHFGPATREEYDQSQWAMVPLSQGAAGPKEDPDPPRRKREPGAPAFLRCRRTDWAMHRVGSLITIYHEIPAARNALLRAASGKPVSDFGHNPEWWMGQPIPTQYVPPPVPEITVSVALTPPPAEDDATGPEQSEGQSEAYLETQPQSPPEAQPDAWPDFSEELLRLIAFLDKTERAYGTGDILRDLLVPQPNWVNDGAFADQQLLDYTKDVNSAAEAMQPFVTSSIAVPAVQASDPVWSSQPHFEWSHVTVLPHSSPCPPIENIYNLLDHLLMRRPTRIPTSEDEAQEALADVMMTFISVPAEIFSLHVLGGGIPATLKVQGTLYLDRYLQPNVEDMALLQLQSYNAVRGISQAAELEQALVWHTPSTPGAEPVDRRRLYRAIVDRDRKSLRDIKAGARWRRYEELRQTGVESQYLPPGDNDEATGLSRDEEEARRHYEARITIYEEKLADLEKRLEELKEERLCCENLLLKLSNRMTEPSEEEDWHPTKKYTLRGINSHPHFVFVCRRAEPNLIEIDDSQASGPAEQWWKLSYQPDAEEPYMAERTTFEKAIEESCYAGSCPVLIYASDKAMDEAPLPLSEALDRFVRLDNRAFREELMRDAYRDKKRGAFSSPASPPKRVNRSSSLDSMATNHVSVGDGPETVDDDLRDAPFEPDDDVDPFLMGEGMGERAVDLEMQDFEDPSLPSSQARQQTHHQQVESTRNHDTGIESPTLGCESDRLANVSLGANPPQDASTQMTNGVPNPFDISIMHPSTETLAQQLQRPSKRLPEMRERGGSLPFVTRPTNNGHINNGGGSGFSGMDMNMELETPREDERPAYSL